MRALADASRAGSALRLTLIGLVLMLAVACAAQYRSHGYIPDEEDLALLEVGRDTRETVAATVGRPSTSGLLNDVGWYYVQSRYKLVGGMAPEEIDRQVVAITFTASGVVENIERFGLEDGQIVALSRRVTTPHVKGQSFLARLFGNIGAIDTSTLFNE